MNPTPSQSNDVKMNLQQTIQTSSAAITNATDNVNQLSSTVDLIQQNISQAIDKVMGAFGNEFENRQKIIQSFKQMTELLKQCNNNNSQSNQPNQPNQSNQSNTQQQQQQQSLNNLMNQLAQYENQNNDLQTTVSTLQQELTTAKTTVSTLQQQLSDAETKYQNLMNLNQQVEIEVSSQISLMDRLNQVIDNLKQKINRLFDQSQNVNDSTNDSNNNTDSKSPNLYLQDTLMAEIRNDVLKGSDFDFIDKTPKNTPLPSLVTKIMQIIQTKCISKVKQMISDLNDIIINLPPGGQSSISVWQSNIEKLKALLSIWGQNASQIVTSWVKTRQNK